MRIVYILLFVAALGWLAYSWRKKTNLKIPIIAAAGTLILNIFPAISYLLLLGALGWVGFSFYKKADKKLPIIAAVASVVLVLTMPSGGGVAGGLGITSGGACTIGTTSKVFGKTSQIKAMFEGYFSDSKVQISVGEGHVTVKNGKGTLNGHQVVMRGMAKEFPGVVDNRFLVTDDGAIYYYKSSENWEIFNPLSLK